MSRWTVNDIPEQNGKVAVVTGANSGLGYISSEALTRKGAQVVMAGRDKAKAQEAINRLKREVPGAKVEFIRLDLADLNSVQEFAADFKARYNRLDLLLNNAGVMTIPERQTAQGFEMQFGTNHLGHFALTALLLDNLTGTPDSRVVTVTSMAHLYGRINFEDLQLRKNYNRFVAYCQSKFANVLFAFELQRRLKAAGASSISLSAHPGYAHTNLQNNSASSTGSLVEKVLYPITNRIVAQSAEMGALPQLYAATAPEVKGGEFYGPRFFTRGYPIKSKATARAYDPEIAARLWNVSEELTGVKYSFEKQAVFQGR